MRMFEVTKGGVSLGRLYVMRALFLLIVVLFGLPTWSTIIEDFGTFEPLEGVAYSFWGALCLLALVGVRYPLKMLPILLIQFLYKTIWLIAVGWPITQSGGGDEYANAMMEAMALGVVLDLIAIPWIFAFREYVLGFVSTGKD